MVDVLLPPGDALRAPSWRATRARRRPVDTTELLFDIRALAAGERCRAPVRRRRRPSPRPRAACRAGTAASRRCAPGSSCASARWKARDGRQPDRAVQGDHRPRHIQAGRRGQPPTACAASRSRPPAATATCWTCSPSTSPREGRRPMPLGPGYGFHAGNPGAPAEDAPADPCYGFFDDAPGARPPRMRRRRAPDDGPAPWPRRPPRGAPTAGRRPRRWNPRRCASRSKGRPAHQPGRRARHHAGHAGAEQQERRHGAVPAARLRPGRPGTQHARPAGIGDVDPHDPDVGGVQPLPAHAARPGQQARQEGRVRVHARRSHRARQGPGREDHRPAHPPWCATAATTASSCPPSARQGKPEHRHDHAVGLAPGRLHRHRGARRRQGPVAREAAEEGARAGIDAPTR